MSTVHPELNNRGECVVLHAPSTPSDPANWDDVDAIATAIPLGRVPAKLNGVAIGPWVPPPGDEPWQPAMVHIFAEPPFSVPTGKSAAAGVAIVESDGRVWLVSPSNQFGGYTNTLPKGRVDSGIGLHATAVREAWEETGMRVELTGFLIDSTRTLTRTRYYSGRRVGGCPSKMGWETQAVHLVPSHQLATMLTHSNDQPVLAALVSLLAEQAQGSH